MGYREVILADGPSAYFRLGERSGTAAADEVGGAAGVYTGGFTLDQPGLPPGALNGSVRTDGATGYVACAHRPEFDLANSGAVEGWALVRSPGIHCFADWGSGGPIVRLDDTMRLLLRRNSVLDIVKSRVTVPRNVPFYWAACWDATSASVWINAVDVSGPVTLSAMANTATPFTIGAADGGSLNFLDGFSDEVALYKRPLPSATVQAHFAAGAPGQRIPYRLARKKGR